jgi:hypothetical protein
MVKSLALKRYLPVDGINLKQSIIIHNEGNGVSLTGSSTNVEAIRDGAVLG